MKYTLGKFAPSAGTALKLDIFDDQANLAETVIVPHVSMIPSFIVELVSEYDIEPTHMRSLLEDLADEHKTASMVVAFKGVETFYDATNDEFVAQTKDGDSGKHVTGHGKRVACAIADLVRSHGFKSKIHNHGPLTLDKWLMDFQYGFNRISDEQLQADMDLMFEPDKGSW